MANIIIVEKDQRVAKEMASYVNEMRVHKCDEFRSFSDFEKSYFGGETEEERLTSVEIFIINLNTITDEIKAFIHNLSLRLKQTGYSTDIPPKFMIVKYEDDGIGKLTLAHPQICDIIFLPMDRLLFLQKVQIVAELPKKATPNYLFTEPVELPIEVSIRSKVSRMTRSGFSLFNQERLAPGTLANVYLSMDKENPLEIPCRVSDYEPMTNNPEDGYLIHFNFYAISQNNQSIINRYIAELDPNFEDFINPRPQVFKPSEDAPIKDREAKYILILDNEISCKSIKAELEENFFTVEASYETVYKDFHAKYFSDSAAKTSSMGNLDDISQPSLVFTVDPETRALMKLQSTVGEDDHFLGYPMKKFFEMPNDWENIFNTEIAKIMLTQALKDAPINRKLKKLADIESDFLEEKLMVFEFMKIGDHEVRIEVKPPLQTRTGVGEKEKSKVKNPKLGKIDIVIANRDFIGENVDSWIKQFLALAKTKKLIRKNGTIQFLIVDQDEELLRRNPPLNRNIVSILHSTGSRKVLFSLIAQALKVKFSMFTPTNLNFAEASFNAHVGQPVKLNAISEYGASINDDKPISPGTIMFLHKSIFEHAPERMLAARFYHTKEMQDEETEDVYHENSFTYFGITDAFLKYARSWIRENYAQKKEAESKSAETKAEEQKKRMLAQKKKESRED